LHEINTLPWSVCYKQRVVGLQNTTLPELKILGHIYILMVKYSQNTQFPLAPISSNCLFSNAGLAVFGSVYGVCYPHVRIAQALCNLWIAAFDMIHAAKLLPAHSFTTFPLIVILGLAMFCHYNRFSLAATGFNYLFSNTTLSNSGLIYTVQIPIFHGL
jgi:hypothetical protein